MRVLVIDDEAMVRKTARRMLERAGHQVVEAENGRAGIEKLASGMFDLVVTDIIMPEMEGIETLLAIRKRFPSLPVVAMSAGGYKGELDFLAVAGKLGAVATLQKPFTLSALVQAVSLSTGMQRVA